jgi:hypothetical protein
MLAFIPKAKLEVLMKTTFAILLTATMLCSSPAHALSCYQESVQDAAKRYDVIFGGIVEKIVPFYSANAKPLGLPRGGSR